MARKEDHRPFSLRVCLRTLRNGLLFCKTVHVGSYSSTRVAMKVGVLEYVYM